MDLIELKIESLDEKGYGTSSLDGKLYLVSNALPGELIRAQIVGRKKKKKLAKAIEIIEASPERIEAIDDGYLATSPLQIITHEGELRYKKEIIEKHFAEVGIELPPFEVKHRGERFGYRNKMEFSGYVDDAGFSLAFHKRDSKRGKIKVDGSVLAPGIVNEVLPGVVEAINRNVKDVRVVKGVTYRYSRVQDGLIIILHLSEIIDLGALLSEISALSPQILGVQIFHSDPLSPAFVNTALMASAGQSEITEQVLDKIFSYPTHGFFQVNIVAFEQIIEDIRAYNYTSKSMTELYAGIGTLGILLHDKFEQITGIELYPESNQYAEKNCKTNGVINYSHIETDVKNALDHIKPENLLLVDPPRSGLDINVINKIIETKPQELLYISCNPITQARDLESIMSSGEYGISYFSAYNLFPCTPHVESVAILKLNGK